MSSIITTFPIDLTGRNATNLITGEEQLLLTHDGLNERVVVMNNGGFYTTGLKVYSADFNELVPNVDYVATYLYVDASHRTGLEICGALVILNPALTGSVLITAQMVGGDYAFSLTAKEDTIEHIRALSGVQPTWAGYVGVEPQWVDGELKRERWEKTSYQDVNYELERIAQTMLGGSAVHENAFRKHVLDAHDYFLDNFDDSDLIDHVNDFEDPHDVTKRQLGFTQVMNRPLATEAISRAGTANLYYQTPQRVHQEVDEKAIKPLNAHKLRTDNPHVDTASQAGMYTRAEFDARINTKLGKYATAVNADSIVSYTETFASVFNKWKRISRIANPTYNLTGDPYSDSAIPGELDTWVLDANNNSVRNTTNSTSLIGLISPEKYDNYVLEATLSSVSTDDDWIGFCIAYAVDNLGRSHTLTVVRGLNGTAPMQIVKDSQVLGDYVLNVYGGLKWPDGTVAVGPRGVSNQPGQGWGNFPAGCKLKVTRDGDIITVETSQIGETGYLTTAKTVFDLRSDPKLAVFRGAQQFGYVTQSQPSSTWEVIQRPPDAKTYNQVYTDVRANLQAGLFTTGIFDQARLGLGTPSANTVLRGNGQWTTLQSIFNEYGSTGGTVVLWAGNLSTQANALNHISITYSNSVAYPVGTIVIYRTTEKYTVGGGNGAATVTVNPTRAAARTASGWINI
jgi:hypothetical protein